MKNTAAGFTLIESLVAIITAAIFITAMFSMYVSLTKLTGSTSEYNTADQLAYNNLRTYAYGFPPKWFTCTYSGSTPQPVTLVNTPTSTIGGIKGNVAQSVVATAPYGCGGGSAGMGYPIKVVSTVVYGNNRTVAHATYVSY